MMSRRNPIRRSGLAAATALLLGACSPAPSPSGEPSEPTAGAEAVPATTTTQSQPLAAVRLCGKRHENPDSSIVCQTTTDVASLYNKVLVEQIKNKCTIFTPTSWQSCMEWPPVLWAEGTSIGNQAEYRAQTERIMTFYRTANSTDVTMRSYELSIQKMKEVSSRTWLDNSDDLEALRKSNKQVLDTGLSDILKVKAAEENRGAEAAAADSREMLAKVQQTLDAHKARVDALQPAYAALVQQFAAYRTNEPVTLAQLQGLVQRASTATLVTLGDVQLELVQLSRAESAAPQQMRLDAIRMSRQLAYEDSVLEEELRPYVAFMQANTIERPQLVAASVRVLESVVSYADSRYQRVSDIVQKTLTGMTRRREALVAQAADNATRQTMTDAATLDASQKFLAEMNARVTQVGKLPPRSTKLRLYYMAGKLLEHEGILQLQPVCARITSTPWMGTGCNALTLQYSKSRTYVTSTIPNTLRLNVSTMRNAGVNGAMLTEVEQHLAANNLRAAAAAHDVAVRASEAL
ncbi:hypothetical protein ACLESD_20265 [Pyxidicoccus sp. 3LFB2]